MPQNTESRLKLYYLSTNELPYLLSFRVAVNWRRKGIDRQPEPKKKNGPRDVDRRYVVAPQTLIDSET